MTDANAGRTTLVASPIAVPPINWLNLVWVALALGAMLAAIVSAHLWALNFLHVGCGLLWTGIDLFMGFVIGPILRRASFEARREVMTRLTPQTMFLLPTLAIITGTTGWYLARETGYLALDYPQLWWIIAALAIVTLLTVLGLGVLLPTQVRIYLELSKPEPDRARIARLANGYFTLVAMQGVMQLVMTAIMTRMRVGL